MIIYDDTCPMCSLYTGGFIKLGFLGKDGRRSFSQLSDEQLVSCLDLKRAKEEIPLVDTGGGPTLYGVDGLVFILSQKLPFIGWMMKISFLDYFFRRLYKMVSFNRRIIIPSDPSKQGIDCTPPFNFKYRIVFIVFALLLSSLITWIFGRSTANYLSVSPATGGWQMLLVAGTGWVLQIITALFFKKNRTIDYLGHLSVVMIIGVLLLLPGVILSSLTNYQYWLIPVISVVMSSSVMLWQHVKRVDHIRSSQWWTVSWFLFLQVTASGWVYVFYLNELL